MTNPFERFKDNPEFSEIYELVLAGEVVMGTTTYKIDVLKGYSNPNILYSTRCYREESFLLQQEVEIKDGKEISGQVKRRMWVHFDLPWTSRETPESAMSHALGCLAELH